jgi:chaperonin GroES
MSWQLLDEMNEWEPETDKLLHVLPITGCVFRKIYFDPGLARNVSTMVSPMDLVINYWAKSMSTAPATEEPRFYPPEIKEMERAELWREIQYTTEQPTDAKKIDTRDDDASREFLEQHRWLDLDDDDFPEPYIVTIHKASSQVVRIKARYDADGIQFSAKDHRVSRINAIEYYTKYDFIPNPDGGIYGLGFGQLLRPINEAVNSSLNMLIDAGHLQNAGNGFIGEGLS